jgi:hypothetical protein
MESAFRLSLRVAAETVIGFLPCDGGWLQPFDTVLGGIARAAFPFRKISLVCLDLIQNSLRAFHSRSGLGLARCSRFRWLPGLTPHGLQNELVALAHHLEYRIGLGSHGDLLG